MIKLGKYLHYKGQLYEVVGEGVHTETSEPVVIYKMLYATAQHPVGSIWVRPKEMFFSNVEVNGESVPRFKYLGDEG